MTDSNQPQQVLADGPGPETTASRRIPELDGLRAVAFGLVFLRHALEVPMAWAGVDVFFVLSGFLITGILLDLKYAGGSYWGRFYSRRVRRILPAYYVALAVATVLFGAAWMHHWWLYVFFGTNFAAAFAPDNFSLQAMWSLAVEEQFYFVWPLVVLWTNERRLRWICIAAVALTPVLRALCTPLFATQFPIYFMTPFRADLLCGGALVQLLWRENRARAAGWKWPAWGLMGALVLAKILMGRGLVWSIASNSRRANATVYSLTLGFSIALLMLCLQKENWVSALLRNRAMRYAGVISYTMYLVHNSVLALVWQHVHQRFAAAVIAYALTFAFASLAWWGWESRILHYRAVPGRSLAAAPSS